jgi:shikimate kinase
MIYLIGYMGSGKTTLAKKLSKQLQLSFLDTDLEIEKKENKSISDIFKDEGELHFRMLETALLSQLNTKKIVACGGGIPMHNDNMSIINKKGISIYLKASANDLANRLKNKKQHRPLIANILNEELEDYIKEDLQQRSSFYALSHHTISINNKTKNELLREVNALICSL